MSTEKNRDELTVQKKATTKEDAISIAVEMSKDAPQYYACVVLSNGEYYVENRVPFIRSWESDLGSWKKGKKVK